MRLIVREYVFTTDLIITDLAIAILFVYNTDDRLIQQHKTHLLVVAHAHFISREVTKNHDRGDIIIDLGITFFFLFTTLHD